MHLSFYDKCHSRNRRIEICFPAKYNRYIHQNSFKIECDTYYKYSWLLLLAKISFCGPFLAIPGSFFLLDIRFLISHIPNYVTMVYNCDLHWYNIIIVDSLLGICGKVEDKYHYFFPLCMLEPGIDLFDNVFSMCTLKIVNTRGLLW